MPPLLLVLTLMQAARNPVPAPIPDPAEAARTLAAQAELREQSGDRAAAADLYRQALAKEELASGHSSSRVAVLLNSLALVSDPPAAIPLLERALKIDRSVGGEANTETATTEVNLCGVLLAAGRIPDAVRTGRAALAAFEAVSGPDHPSTAVAASALADALRAQRNFAAAQTLYRRALAIDETAFGPTHAEVQADIRNLSDVLRAMGRKAEAADLEKRLTRP